MVKVIRCVAPELYLADVSHIAATVMKRSIEQEAQLPQRNSASATHDYLGWSADLLMITQKVS